MPNTDSKSKDFLHYIHHFRGLAILFIVAIHAVISFPWDNVMAKKVILTITNNGTVLFVFIAGFLFYYLCHDRFSPKTYLVKKFKFVIIPYLIISIPAIIDKLYFDPGNHWWMTEAYSEQPAILQVLMMLATGRHSGVLWFIPMIIIFYLLSFILIRFGRSQPFDYLTPIIALLGLLTVSFGYYSNPLTSFVHFLPVYLLGMWTCKHKEALLNTSRVLLLLMAFIYLVMTYLEIVEVIPFDKYLDFRDTKEHFFVLNLSKLKAMLLCFLLLLFFKKYNHKKWPVLKKLGDYSFGIFFLHLYLINAAQIIVYQGILPMNSLNLLSFTMYLMILIFTGMFVIWLTKLTFGKKSRMLLGS